jgi:hypothetical protein
MDIIVTRHQELDLMLEVLESGIARKHTRIALWLH